MNEIYRITTDDFLQFYGDKLACRHEDMAMGLWDFGGMETHWYALQSGFFNLNDSIRYALDVMGAIMLKATDEGNLDARPAVTAQKWLDGFWLAFARPIFVEQSKFLYGVVSKSDALKLRTVRMFNNAHVVLERDSMGELRAIADGKESSYAWEDDELIPAETMPIYEFKLLLRKLHVPGGFCRNPLIVWSLLRGMRVAALMREWGFAYAEAQGIEQRDAEGMCKLKSDKAAWDYLLSQYNPFSKKD